MSNKKIFFASSNSSRGFQSYFDSIYNSEDLIKIYIIKGGAGTGKSSLINSVGERFEKNSDCEYFLCSSDTSSYDGLIIDNKFAIIDGTSPHSVEAKYPGAVEVIVDNGRGILKSMEKHKEEILKISKRKTALYKSAYAYLNSAGELKKEYCKMLSEHYHIEKLESAVNRFFRQNIKRKAKYNQKLRLIRGITPEGIFDTGSFEMLSERKCVIINGEGFSSIIFDLFLKFAKEHNLETIISYDPLIPYTVNGLYFPEEKLCVTEYSSKIHGEIDYDKYKVFNADRFINKDMLSMNRSKLRFSLKCKTSLINEAISYLKEASDVHKELEQIYKENMNYEFIDGYIDEICDDIKNLQNNR